MYGLCWKPNMSVISNNEFKSGRIFPEKWLSHKINYSRTLGLPHIHIIHVVFSHNTKENVALEVVMQEYIGLGI